MTECAVGAGAALASLAEALTVIVMLAAVAEALVEFLVGKLWSKFSLDEFWLQYISAAVAFALVLLSGQNLLAEYLPASPAMIWVGRVLTALLAGRGSEWVRNFFSNARTNLELKRLQARAIRGKFEL